MKLCDELNVMCARFGWGQCGDKKKKDSLKELGFISSTKEGGGNGI